MSKMLDAFKIKPFDLEPIYAAWPDCPRFLGIPQKDPPVDEWLDQIKAGCAERKVPQEYWHRVAQHYMGDKAKARFVHMRIADTSYTDKMSQAGRAQDSDGKGPWGELQMAVENVQDCHAQHGLLVALWHPCQGGGY